MGRGLIQKRKALRAQLFFPPHAKEKDYPVLSFLSEGYPGLLGRLPTRYSPVRRYPKKQASWTARLACVKHAASVRSEPGSN
ncbi:hypothetical protein HKBW3S42_01928, partial [Candidatus Hakubella thermalkaliphila]